MSAASPPSVREETPFRRFVSEFSASNLALVGLLGFTIIAFLAIFAPWITPQNPYDLAQLDIMDGRLPPGSPSLGELLAQGKNNLHAPWLGITGFMVLALMLSLLVFVGEAVRDAFDPRKTVA